MNTLFIGHKLIYKEHIDSTNRYLMEAAKSTFLPEGTVVRAADQYAGKGQQGNTWESAPGENLLFSFLLRPAFLSASQQFDLNIAVCVGLYDVLCSYTDHVKVKWPNDIYVQDRKLGGILIENTLKGSTISTATTGIGLNINQLTFPKTLPHATSLAICKGQHYDLQELLQAVLSGIEKRYLQLRAGKREEIKQQYLKVLYRYAHYAPYSDSKGQDFLAKITGISDSGKLLVELENGLQQSYAHKEIVYRQENT